MSAAETLTVRCHGPTALRLRWYRSLAQALAATAPPAGVLFEATAENPTPVATVRPRSLIETVAASPGVRGLDLERFPDAPPLEPPPGWSGEIRLLVLPYPFGPLRPPPSVPTDAPDLAPLVGPRGWVGFQTAWVRGARGDVRVARRFRLATPDETDLDCRVDAVSVAVALEWAGAVGGAMTTRRAPRGSLRDWRRGGLARVPPDAWVVPSGRPLERTAEYLWSERAESAGAVAGHRIVFGASGAGKTTFLARHAADQANRGSAVVVLDLHGDLAPLAFRFLGATARARAVAVDASSPPVPGVAALAPGPVPEDRSAAHLVAALKRLSPDGTDLHWGFRLERIFDSFVRIVQESDGSLVDLYGLLTDSSLREAARLRTRRSDLARFLEELEPVLKRQPDFLWSAATRLSKVVLVPALRELLAPSDGGVPVEEILLEGRSLFVRIPFAVLGPEAASFAGTLILARLYLGLAARKEAGSPHPPILFVLDEVQGLAPRLVAELLTESRKFGLRSLVATQYPDRLSNELRGAAAGSLTDVVAFRVPRRSAGSTGEWVGLTPEEAERSLPGLPAGHGVRFDPEAGVVRAVPAVPPGPDNGLVDWANALVTTREEFGPTPDPSERLHDDRDVVDRILLAVLAAEEEGRPIAGDGVIAAALALPGVPWPADRLAEGWNRAVRHGFVRPSSLGSSLTPAGERVLGLTAPTAASNESAEHRGLLLAAFRVFARRGYRIEILRQGRFDTTLPDAVFRQIPERSAATPAELGEAVDRARRGWAWRFFSGRDVFIEAEVSGALRRERIRHGWRKALARGAFVLFVVGDAVRARRVRAALDAMGVPRGRAQVWTLPVVRRTSSPGGVANE